jgi:hypothetical protein
VTAAENCTYAYIDDMGRYRVKLSRLPLCSMESTSQPSGASGKETSVWNTFIGVMETTLPLPAATV